MRDVFVHLRRLLAHWLRVVIARLDTIANRVDPDLGDAYEANLRDLVESRTP